MPSRLSGCGSSSAVFRLDTGFGDYKMHCLIALIHDAREGSSAPIVGGIVSLPFLPTETSVAAFDDEASGPSDGRTMGDGRVDIDDLDDMPAMTCPALSTEDPGAIAVQPLLLPQGYELPQLDDEDFAVEEPLSRRRRRATVAHSFHANHFDHTDFRTSGSASFRLDGRPEVR